MRDQLPRRPSPVHLDLGAETCVWQDDDLCRHPSADELLGRLPTPPPTVLEGEIVPLQGQGQSSPILTAAAKRQKSVFKCDICDREFNHASGLGRHRSSTHPVEFGKETALVLGTSMAPGHIQMPPDSVAAPPVLDPALSHVLHLHPPPLQVGLDRSLSVPMDSTTQPLSTDQMVSNDSVGIGQRVAVPTTHLPLPPEMLPPLDPPSAAFVGSQQATLALDAQPQAMLQPQAMPGPSLEAQADLPPEWQARIPVRWNAKP
jgi:hypothetical protein